MRLHVDSESRDHKKFRALADFDMIFESRIAAQHYLVAWAVVVRLMLQGPGLAQEKRVTSLAPVEPAEATRFRARLSTSAHTQHEVRDNNHA